MEVSPSGIPKLCILQTFSLIHVTSYLLDTQDQKFLHVTRRLKKIRNQAIDFDLDLDKIIA